MLRYSTDNSVPPIPKHAVLFNYLGRTRPPTGAPFQPTRPLELVRGPTSNASFPLQVNAVVSLERLLVTWTRSTALNRQTLQHLAHRHHHFVQELMDAATRGEATPTISDFPLAGLKSGDLDKLSALLGDS